MRLGNKSQVIMSALGVKNSRPYSSLGVKQSHNPRLDVDALIRNNTPNGIINNESNSNDTHYQPIKGISLPNYKNTINSNRNTIEKAHKIKRSSDKSHFI